MSESVAMSWPASYKHQMYGRKLGIHDGGCKIARLTPSLRRSDGALSFQVCTSQARGMEETLQAALSADEKSLRPPSRIFQS